MIDICMSISDKDGIYARFVGTCITSIFANTKARVKIHLLHDDKYIVNGNDI